MILTLALTLCSLGAFAERYMTYEWELVKGPFDLTDDDIMYQCSFDADLDDSFKGTWVYDDVSENGHLHVTIIRTLAVKADMGFGESSPGQFVVTFNKNSKDHTFINNPGMSSSSYGSNSSFDIFNNYNVVDEADGFIRCYENPDEDLWALHFSMSDTNGEKSVKFFAYNSNEGIENGKYLQKTNTITVDSADITESKAEGGEYVYAEETPAPTMPVDDPAATRKPAQTAAPLPTRMPAATPAKNDDPVSDLTALGIVKGDPNGNMRLGDAVTRAEMSAIICRLRGMTETPETADTVFDDVKSEHWASGYINEVCNIGVINGYDDGTFRPDNDVTYQEAVKMLVSLLGYAPKADMFGGYPEGYLEAARQHGLTSGVEFSPEAPCTRGDVFILAENALDIPLMMQKDGADLGVYVICDGTLNEKGEIEVPLRTLRTENFGK